MGDVGRCVLRAAELPESSPAKRYCRLTFETNDAAADDHPPLYYSVEKVSKKVRRIIWNEAPPAPPPPVTKEEAEEVRAVFEAKKAARQKEAKK
jgi:hypothetical protein